MGVYRPRNPRASALWQCARRHAAELCESGRIRRPVEQQVIECFIECGDPYQGFARIYCDACEHDWMLAARARAACVRLIRKVYEADPLECPKCNSPMRVIALIDDPTLVRRILEHCGLWAPEASGPGPPAVARDWPSKAIISLTYHPLPDIA